MKKLYLLSGVSILIIILAVAYVLFHQAQFTLTSSNPANGGTDFAPGSPLTFTFSQSLDLQTARQFTISPMVQGQATISNKTLTFTPTTGLVSNSDYKVTITNPVDTDGHVGSTVQISFSTGDEAQSALPQSQQQAAKQQTDSIQKQDPFTQYLPQQALDYTVSYSADATGKITYLITLNVVPRYAGDPTYIPALKSAQTEALTWIKSVGGNPATMNIVYNPDPNTGVYNPALQQ